MRLKKDDMVEVIAGNDKGERGKILRVEPKLNRIVIQGVNIVRKHRRPVNTGGRQVEGGVVEQEAAIDASNVMLVCPHTDQLTRVGVRRDESGRRIRFSKKSGKDID